MSPDPKYMKFDQNKVVWLYFWQKMCCYKTIKQGKNNIKKESMKLFSNKLKR